MLGVDVLGGVQISGRVLGKGVVMVRGGSVREQRLGASVAVFVLEEWGDGGRGGGVQVSLSREGVTAGVRRGHEGRGRAEGVSADTVTQVDRHVLDLEGGREGEGT